MSLKVSMTHSLVRGYHFEDSPEDRIGDRDGQGIGIVPMLGFSFDRDPLIRNVQLIILIGMMSVDISRGASVSSQGPALTGKGEGTHIVFDPDSSHGHLLIGS